MSARVLIVEDDEGIRELTILLLEDAGYDVAHAVDGQEAVNLLKMTRPDVLVLDLMLPKIDGIAILMQLTRLAPDLPVVVMTAYPLAQTVGQISAMIPHSKVWFLSKPFESDDLKANVALALGASA